MKNQNPIIENIDESSTIWDAFELIAHSHPKITALQIWQNNQIAKSLSYADLKENSKKRAEKLQKIGINPGDRVALLEENSIDWIETFLAILLCRATAVLIDPKLEGKDYQNLIKQTDPQLIIISKPLFEKIPQKEALGIPFLEISAFGLLTPLKELKHAIDGNPSFALILFTSGTTGTFRGVILHHTSALCSVKIIHTGYPFSVGDQVLNILPFTHVYGLIDSLLSSLTSGATFTLVDKIYGDAILKALKETKTTVFLTVPRVIELFHTKIKRHIESKSSVVRFLLQKAIAFCAWIKEKTGLNLGRYIFSSIHNLFGGHLKLFASGGAPFNYKIAQDMVGLGFPLTEGYGATETAGVVVCVGTKYYKPGSIGKIDLWNSLRIVTSGHGSIGEIVLKGKSIMEGYFREPEATAEVLKDGWFHTGDLGYIDKDGYIYIQGRIKEIIVTSSGHKAMPHDVEKRYSDLHGIQELAVFGVPSLESHAEDLHAAVVVSEALENELDLEAQHKKVVESILKRHPEVPSHLRIHKVHIVPSIPKTTTLKVKRHILKSMFKPKKEGD